MADEKTDKKVETASAPRKKGTWDKIDVILKPVGGLMTALMIVIVGNQFNSSMKERETSEANLRLYTELISKREESESALRKDMFTSIINNFMEPAVASLEAKVLNLELLTYNFHESLNLKPLFSHLKGQIAADSAIEQATKRNFQKRLSRVAKEITRKQMVALEGGGQKFDRTIEWGDADDYPGFVVLDEGSLTLDGIERTFMLFVEEIDRESQEVEINLEILTPGRSAESHFASFGISFFDFPMIDNMRLSNDQRCAVILNDFGESSADITLIYFPGCYASLKEKPYYQDVVQNLIKMGKLFDQKEKAS